MTIRYYGNPKLVTLIKQMRDLPCHVSVFDYDEKLRVHQRASNITYFIGERVLFNNGTLRINSDHHYSHVFELLQPLDWVYLPIPSIGKQIPNVRIRDIWLRRETRLYLSCTEMYLHRIEAAKCSIERSHIVMFHLTKCE